MSNGNKTTNNLSSRQKAVLAKAVKKTVKDYGKTLKLLAQQ